LKSIVFIVHPGHLVSLEPADWLLAIPIWSEIIIQSSCPGNRRSRLKGIEEVTGNKGFELVKKKIFLSELLDDSRQQIYINRSMDKPAVIKADQYLDFFSGNPNRVGVQLLTSFLNLNSIINNVPF
jgi:hypothetical protein